MTPPRLKARVLVQSVIRRAMARGTFATVVRSGDPDAGAVYVKLNRGADGCTILAPSRRPEDGAAVWLPATGEAPVPEEQADAYVERERRIDPDLWVVEVEDREGWNPME